MVRGLDGVGLGVESVNSGGARQTCSVSLAALNFSRMWSSSIMGMVPKDCPCTRSRQAKIRWKQVWNVHHGGLARARVYSERCAQE